MEFQRFIRKHLPGLKILPVSTTRVVPGVIIDPDRMQMLGHCREILPDEPEERWAYDHSDASMIYGTITANRKMRSGMRVMGVFSLRSTFDRDLSVHLEINDIRGAMLNTSQLALQPRINALRATDRRGRWRKINNKLVVLETFYASEFVATFFRHDQMVTQAELEELSKLDIEASIDFQWRAGRQLVITQNANVPFGVRGFIV